jgi:hypothetical protein
MNGAQLAAAVFNVGGKFIKKPFLELNEDDFMAGMEANGYDLGGHAPPKILEVELMDADCTAFQQGRVPLRPSLPPTPPRSDLR